MPSIGSEPHLLDLEAVSSVEAMKRVNRKCIGSKATKSGVGAPCVHRIHVRIMIVGHPQNSNWLSLDGHNPETRTEFLIFVERLLLPHLEARSFVHIQFVCHD